jgi:hypothetical protein
MKRFKQFIKEDSSVYLNSNYDKFHWFSGNLNEDSALSEEIILEDTGDWLGTDNPNARIGLNREVLNKSVDSGKTLHGKKYNIPINDDRQTAIWNYTGSGHRFMNHLHRNGEMHPDSFKPRESLEKDSGILDNLIADHTTLKSAHLWRGIGPDAIKHMNTKVGQVFHDKGFVSTTFHPEVAKKFAERNTPVSEDLHLIHIKLPKESKALHPLTYDSGAMRTENEVIMPRGSKFRYDGNEQSKNEYGDKFTLHHLTHIPGE